MPKPPHSATPPEPSRPMKTARSVAADCIERFARDSWSGAHLVVGAEQIISGELHRCIHDFVLAHRDSSAGPEAMIVTVKELVKDSVPVYDAISPITQTVLPWAIEAYFEP